MNATEQARRSDALYYSGNRGISRRWLCDKVASLERENAELRELVRDLLHHIEYPPCEGCLSEMSCAGDLSQCDEYFDWLKPRARKMGVEVDE